ncbi:MAG TPA: type II toxin-antitoxin system prevent-host-death family antitoxin [Actinomycetota bacterium]|nr:type II toxin-antitoxin system prevent-host-death family antitoxin [Actinomycetota bacterium]
MENLTATEVARRLSEVLDAVEHEHRSFVVHRYGRPVARLGPVPSASGAALKALLRRAPRDPSWPEELARLRELVALEGPRWNA